MVCPLDAVTLVPRRLESDVNVEICPVCSGVWLEQGELEALQAAHAHDRPAEEPESVRAAFDMARRELEPPGPCPVCGVSMDRHEYGYASQILVDACPRGHGLWLDAGELEALERFFARQRANSESPAPSRSLWSRVVAALRGDQPIE